MLPEVNEGDEEYNDVEYTKVLVIACACDDVDSLLSQPSGAGGEGRGPNYREEGEECTRGVVSVHRDGSGAGCGVEVFIPNPPGPGDEVEIPGPTTQVQRNYKQEQEEE